MTRGKPAGGRDRTDGNDVAAGRDANGEILTNEKFPDMKGLVDYIHGKGLKAGIYSGPGNTTCQGLAASYQHEAQDARTYAKWGFDYLKYDWCGYPVQANTNSPLDVLQKPYTLMRGVLDSLDRDIVFSLCQYGWGRVWEWGDTVGGNLWRVTGDITDTWVSMSSIGFQQTGHEKFAGPGHWNDTDMLVVGHLGWGRLEKPRPTNLTPNEQLTHISLWALQAAPLLIGADMTQIDDWTINLLGNREVLAINQDPLGRAAGRIASDNWTQVWARPLADGDVRRRTLQPWSRCDAGDGDVRRYRRRRRFPGPVSVDPAGRSRARGQLQGLHRRGSPPRRRPRQGRAPEENVARAT